MCFTLKDSSEEQVEIENRRLDKAKETFKVQKAELEVQLKARQNAVTNMLLSDLSSQASIKRL
jgi:hypothetical protein